jgi:hypothetical protein
VFLSRFLFFDDFKCGGSWMVLGKLLLVELMAGEVMLMEAGLQNGRKGRNISETKI